MSLLSCLMFDFIMASIKSLSYCTLWRLSWGNNKEENIINISIDLTYKPFIRQCNTIQLTIICSKVTSFLGSIVTLKLTFLMKDITES